jgi:hypothetical protein
VSSATSVNRAGGRGGSGRTAGLWVNQHHYRRVEYRPGFHRGVATDAAIIGYGSGVVISIFDAVGGFDYALAHKDSFAAPIKVISNSWGTTGRRPR